MLQVVWHCVAVAGHGAGVICFMIRGNSTGHGVLCLCVSPPPPPDPPAPLDSHSRVFVLTQEAVGRI